MKISQLLESCPWEGNPWLPGKGRKKEKKDSQLRGKRNISKGLNTAYGFLADFTGSQAETRRKAWVGES